jgi:ariadne-1
MSEYEFDESATWASQPASTDDLFERPAVKERPVIMAHADVMREVEAAVDDVVNVMAWSRTSALLMLRHCKYSADIVKERYFEDPEALVKSSGVADMDDRFVIADTTCDCLMCWDTCPAATSASLACCHPFCFPCWASHLEFHLKNSGNAAIAVRCPQKACPQFCGRLAFERIFGRPSEQLTKYDAYVISSFVANNERFRECPGPGCGLVCKYPVGRSAIAEGSAPVPCSCGYRYCFLCGLEDHSPASCSMMKMWLKKESDESETANWVSANTKPCPGKHCGKTVEKNGGCNHMTCSQCRYEWCWICEGPWSEHGSSYYKCNYFKDDDEKAKMRNRSRDAARTELERYIHYYSRYQNHGRSRKLDQIMLQRTQQRIARELANTTQSILDLDYLTTTATVLTQCRHTLMYTYVFAYYLADAKRKDLFEYNQSQLEYWTELLSEFIEDATGAHTKQEVVNRTSTAERMLKKLQEGCFPQTTAD